MTTSLWSMLQLTSIYAYHCDSQSCYHTSHLDQVILKAFHLGTLRQGDRHNSFLGAVICWPIPCDGTFSTASWLHYPQYSEPNLALRAHLPVLVETCLHLNLDA